MRTRVMGNAEIGQKGAEKMTAEDVKKSLIRQLEDRGANVEHFLALIDDYVFYYKQEKKAQAEVRKNGMTIKATSAFISHKIGCLRKCASNTALLTNTRNRTQT